MNKSLLVAVCDFTILSILSIATFGPIAKPQAKASPNFPKTSLQNELFEQLKVSLEQEQLKGESRDKDFEKQRLEAEKFSRTWP